MTSTFKPSEVQAVLRKADAAAHGNPKQASRLWALARAMRGERSGITPGKQAPSAPAAAKAVSKPTGARAISNPAAAALGPLQPVRRMLRASGAGESFGLGMRRIPEERLQAALANVRPGQSFACRIW